MQTSFKYYEINAVIDGEIELLFGSYDRYDCTSELECEKDSWKEQGYKKFKITRVMKTEAPSPAVYDCGITAPILKSGNNLCALEAVGGDLPDFVFYKDGDRVFSLRGVDTNTARLLAHWNNHIKQDTPVKEAFTQVKAALDLQLEENKQDKPRKLLPSEFFTKEYEVEALNTYRNGGKVTIGIERLAIALEKQLDGDG